MSVQGDVKSDFENAQRAQELQTSWMMSFQAACQRKDWMAAEEAQTNTLAALDAFMCHYAAGHKRLERA